MIGRIHFQEHDNNEAYVFLQKSRDVEKTYRSNGLSLALVNLWHIEAKRNYSRSINLIEEMKFENKGSTYEKLKYLYYSTNFIYEST